MTTFLRRMFVILSLTGIIFFVHQINPSAETVYHPKTLIALGFLILSAYTIGEIFFQIKLPRIVAYLMIGLLFGSNSQWLLGVNYFMIADGNVVADMKFISIIALSIIAISAGMEINLGELKKFWKSISIILSVQLLSVVIFVGLISYLIFTYFYLNSGYSQAEIIAASVLIGIISFGTSIELTLAVHKETSAKNRFTDLVMNSVIIKDFIIIILFAFALSVSSRLITKSTLSENIFLDFFKEFSLSVLLGLASGILFNLYLKYIEKEILISFFAFIIFISELAVLFHLELMIVFLIAGYVIKNYSSREEKLEAPLQKLLLLIFLIFFTYIGASINLSVVLWAVYFSAAIFIARIISVYYSFKISGKFINEETQLKEKGWIGFLSQSGLAIGLTILVADKIPGIGAEVKNIASAVIIFNMILGPIIYKTALISIFKPFGINKTEHSEDEKITDSEKKKLANSKFEEPNFQDTGLNKSLFNILFKLNDIIDNFNKNFIHQRSEESLGLVISATETYTDDFIKLKNILSNNNLTPQEISDTLLNVKEKLAETYIDLISERKVTEKNILKLEPLVKDLFISLIDLTDSLQKKFVVGLEKPWVDFSKNEKLKAKYFKVKNRIKNFVMSFYDSNFRLQRTIEYRNLAKYYLIGQSSGEILETVNLVGAERLNTLRQIRRLFQDYSNYLDELIILSYQEKKNKELHLLILSKLDKIHSMFVNEIKIYNHEISNTTEELSARLAYSLASPFNKLLQEIRVAGTYESKQSKLKYSKIFSQSETAKDFTMETIRFWMNYYIGYLGLFKKDVLISSIKVKLSKIVNEYLISVLEEINLNLVNVFAEINLIQEKIGHRIEETIQNKGNLVELIEHQKDELILPMINKYIAKLEEIKSSKKIKFITELIIEEFSKISDELPEDIKLLEETDFKFNERRPMFIGLRKAKVREIAAQYLGQKLPREISEINELILNHLNLSLGELKNLIAMVDYHSLSIVQSESENNGKEIIVELAYSLIDKIDHRINQLHQQIDRLGVNINKKILERVSSSVIAIEKLLLESSITKSALQMEAEIGKNRIKSLSVKTLKDLTHIAAIAQNQLKKFYNLFFRDRLKQFLIDFNIKERAAGTEPESLFLNEEKLKGLPFIYRKLFDGSPLESNDFFINSKELSNKVTQQLQNFRENRNSATLVIGEPGSGKKTLINSLKNSYLNDANIFHIQISETVTTKSQLLNIISKSLGLNRTLKLDELLITLNDKSNKKLIIIETLAKLYFRNVDGYSAIKTLFYLISATNNNVFWLCTIGKLPYQFLNSNFEFGKLFSEKILINELHRQELKTILLSRHNATGYDLKYLPDDFTELKNKFIRKRSLNTDQNILSDEYFKKLEEYSTGNIISAMFYWLQSIQKVEENTIIIKPPRKISLEHFQGLNDIYLLSLSQILFHGSLTDQEHQKLFGFGLEESKEILNYLESLNLIYKDSIDYLHNRYFINKFLYKIIENELTRRNMI